MLGSTLLDRDLVLGRYVLRYSSEAPNFFGSELVGESLWASTDTPG